MPSTLNLHIPSLTDPKLLFKSNSSGFVRKSVSTTIDAGASVVNDAINKMKRELAEFRRDQNENNNLVQHQVAAIHIDMENQTNAVAQIGNQLQQSALFLLAGHNEKQLKEKFMLLTTILPSKHSAYSARKTLLKELSSTPTLGNCRMKDAS